MNKDKRLNYEVWHKDKLVGVLFSKYSIENLKRLLKLDSAELKEIIWKEPPIRY